MISFLLIHLIQPAPRLLLCPVQKTCRLVAVHHQTDGGESFRLGLLQEQGARLFVIVPVEDEIRYAEIVYLDDVFHGNTLHGLYQNLNIV